MLNFVSTNGKVLRMNSQEVDEHGNSQVMFLHLSMVNPGKSKTPLTLQFKKALKHISLLLRERKNSGIICPKL